MSKEVYFSQLIVIFMFVEVCPTILNSPSALVLTLLNWEIDILAPAIGLTVNLSTIVPLILYLVGETGGFDGGTSIFINLTSGRPAVVLAELYPIIRSLAKSSKLVETVFSASYATPAE